MKYRIMILFMLFTLYFVSCKNGKMPLIYDFGELLIVLDKYEYSINSDTSFILHYTNISDQDIYLDSFYFDKLENDEWVLHSGWCTFDGPYQIEPGRKIDFTSNFPSGCFADIPGIYRLKIIFFNSNDEYINGIRKTKSAISLLFNIVE